MLKVLLQSKWPDWSRTGVHWEPGDDQTAHSPNLWEVMKQHFSCIHNKVVITQWHRESRFMLTVAFFVFGVALQEVSFSSFFFFVNVEWGDPRVGMLQARCHFELLAALCHCDVNVSSYSSTVCSHFFLLTQFTCIGCRIYVKDFARQIRFVYNAVAPSGRNSRFHLWWDNICLSFPVHVIRQQLTPFTVR